MKVFFALLLIANIGFAVFQFLLPYDQLFVDTRKVPAAVELQLLSEANSEVVKQAKVDPVAEPAVVVEASEPALSSAEPASVEPEETLLTEAVSDKRVCYTIGPVKDKSRAIEISGRYSAKRIATALKSSREKQYMGMMVFIGGHKSRNEALETANALSAKGVLDHIILNSPERPNLLSLGVFGLKKNADRLRDRVRKLGFDAQTETRYRERTIYWVYAEQSSEDALEQLLKQAELEDGISQIPTQCLPS